MTDFIASIGSQCLEFPGESMFTAFRVALLYVLQTDRKTMLWHPLPPPGRAQTAKGLRSNIAIWPAGISLQ